MKRKKGKIISILLTILSIILICSNAYAHSGRTDSSGGHKDNKNKSGLGSYHYHCGGHPAHLHTNGVCPYSSSKKSTSNSSSNTKTTTKTNTKTNTKANTNSNSKTNSTETTPKTPPTIYATEIKINENIGTIEEGESKALTATISPSNVTDKNITWKSSNENVATVNSKGEVIAKKSGIVEIIASTSNGKTNAVAITVKEKPKKEDNNTTVKKVVTVTNSNVIPKSTSATTNTNTLNSSEETNPVRTVLALGILGGGGYLGYRKYKKTKV